MFAIGAAPRVSTPAYCTFLESLGPGADNRLILVGVSRPQWAWHAKKRFKVAVAVKERPYEETFVVPKL